MKTYTVKRALSSAIAVLALLASQPLTALEKPEFQVIQVTDDVEIRRYAPTIIARTLVDDTFSEAGNEGFKRLATYIFGGNIRDQKISMTAPVGLVPDRDESTDPRYWITFTMPRAYSLDALPVPDDRRVELLKQPERYMAVLRYKGGWSEARFRKHEAKLLQWIDQSRTWQQHGPASWARYNPPIVPSFMRTNEVAVEVMAAASGACEETIMSMSTSSCYE